jgi:hypothetical protein
LSKLNKSVQDAYIRLKNEAVYGVYGKRYIPLKSDGSMDVTQDFPNIEDPTDYVTHIPLEQEEVQEADVKNPKKELEKVEDSMEEESEFEVDDKSGDSEVEAGAETDETSMDMPEGETPGADMMGGAGDMGAGMPPAEPELTLGQLGRIYELKKIYSRLSSVEMFLSRSTDDNVLEIRKMVSNSIDLFELVVSNFQQYKDKIDEIIVTYYEFLKVVYESIKNHYRRISKQ